MDKAREVDDHNLFYGTRKAKKTGRRDKNEPLSLHREATILVTSGIAVKPGKWETAIP